MIVCLVVLEIENGDCIYLDVGMMMLVMIFYIEVKDVIVVINGLFYVEVFVSKWIWSYLFGGMMKIYIKVVIGSIVL